MSCGTLRPLLSAWPALHRPAAAKLTTPFRAWPFVFAACEPQLSRASVRCDNSGWCTRMY